jgi:hypothetical protein
MICVITCGNQPIQSVTKSKMGKANDRDLTIFASKDGKVDEIPFNNAKSQETYISDWLIFNLLNIM